MKNLFYTIIALFIALVFTLALLTPEKTKAGDYTNPLLYWTDNAYVSENF